MNKWKLEITFDVADSWIADVFNVNERLEEISESLSNLLPYATEDEFKIGVKIIEAPDRQRLIGLQKGTIEIED